MTPSGVVNDVVSCSDSIALIDYLNNSKNVKSFEELQLKYGRAGGATGEIDIVEIEDYHDIYINVIDKMVKKTLNIIYGSPEYEFLTCRIHRQNVPWGLIHTDDAYAEDTPTNLNRISLLFNIDYTNEASTVLFDQRYFGNRKYKHHHYIRLGQFRNEVLNPVKGFNISNDIYNKYLHHIDKKDLIDLSVEQVIKWKKGQVIYFSSNQLHASGATNLNEIKYPLVVLIKI